MRASRNAACRRGCARVLLAGMLHALPVAAQVPAPGPSQTSPAEAAPASGAQGSSADGPEAGAAPMTLHVYAVHVQIPTLVLTRSLQPLPAMDAAQFRIRLDSGRPFPPSSVHLEGEDPINLAVVFDAAGSEVELMNQLVPALVQLRTGALHAQDTLRFFAVDCATVRYSAPLPLQVEGINHAASVVLDAPALHRGKSHAACENSLQLWDTIAYAVKALAPMEGRRVILAITAGQDRGSKNTWPALAGYATARSVAIFAVTGKRSSYGSFDHETPLWSLCGLTGGIALPPISAVELPEQMNVFVGMLRRRYILEFARSNKMSAGEHTVDVDVPHTHALVRVTGVSVPMLDSKTRDDPTTIPYLEADRPELGTRRPLKPESLPK